MADEKKIRVGIVSLGCPKTLVDSEVILGKAQCARYSITQDIEKSDVVLLNTCGFIKPSTEESLTVISEAIELKASAIAVPAKPTAKRRT